MNRYTYEKSIGEFYINESYLKEKELSKDLINDKNILIIVNTSYNKLTVSNMLKPLDNVVIIFAIFSWLLLFVVLYNLSYINISERKLYYNFNWYFNWFTY